MHGGGWTRWHAPLATALACLVFGFCFRTTTPTVVSGPTEAGLSGQESAVVRYLDWPDRVELFRFVLRRNTFLVSCEVFGTACLGAAAVPQLVINGSMLAASWRMAEQVSVARNKGRWILFLHVPLEFLALVLAALPGFRLALDLWHYVRRGSSRWLSWQEGAVVAALAYGLVVAAAGVEAFVVPWLVGVCGAR